MTARLVPLSRRYRRLPEGALDLHDRRIDVWPDDDDGQWVVDDTARHSAGVLLATPSKTAAVYFAVAAPLRLGARLELHLIDIGDRAPAALLDWRGGA
jgi:hypothetical protein